MDEGECRVLVLLCRIFVRLGHVLVLLGRVHGLLGRGLVLLGLVHQVLEHGLVRGAAGLLPLGDGCLPLGSSDVNLVDPCAPGGHRLVVLAHPGREVLLGPPDAALQQLLELSLDQVLVLVVLLRRVLVLALATGCRGGGGQR